MKISDELYARLQTASRESFEELIDLAVQEALRALPLVIDNITKQTAVMRTCSEKFYSENPELQNHKPLVAETLQRVESENPGASYETLLAKTKPQVFANLNAATKFGSGSAKTTAKKLELFDLDSQVNKL